MQFSLPAENVFIDLSDRAKLRLTGADRVRFLNGQMSNDVRRATNEEAVYTGVMTIKGKLCADAYVHAGDDFLLLDADPDVRDTLPVRLERYVIADDVEISDVSDALGLFHLLDFTGADLLPALPAIPSELQPAVRAVRAVRYGWPGLDLFFDAGLIDEVRAHLAVGGRTLLNADAVESLRILLGVPRWGAELDENTLPAEAGIEDRAVSYSKGCYIGQEVVSRIRSVGHVNRHLRGLRALDASPLYPGMRLLPPENATGKDAGRITSAAASAGHGGAAFVALGYVRTPWAAPGTRLDAAAPASAAPAAAAGAANSGVPEDDLPPACAVEVCSLPFVTK